MQIIPSLAAATIAFGAIAATADAEHVQRQLILGGKRVTIATKTYTVGIRPTADGESFCGGSLISPTHVLTTAACLTDEAKFVGVGTHYIKGTKEGEQIKVVKGQSHTKYNATSGSYDIGILTLEKPSKFKPVNLPAADDTDTIPGMWAEVMGWGNTSYPNGATSNQLRGVDLRDNKDCSPVFLIDYTMVCAGGAPGKDACDGDTGAPLIKEKGRGDSDDILIGVSSWRHGCGNACVPGVYSRVSVAVEWIKSVTKKN
ncbi:unnamed protein product [Phytophthora lilii]|uniref:Unnamed protein product n=1 Tax=Phytophthora lilii TaxID=2077276 RepID=A0A9W6TC01_9STRA|nr:unnamed protein product [Phytophthora lilii]